MSKKLKILICITSLEVGGAEKMCYELVTRLPKTRYDVSILVFKHKGYFGHLLESMGIEVISLNMRSMWDITRLYKIREILKNRTYDISHGFMFHGNIFSRVLKYIAKVKTNISSIHTIEMGKMWHNHIERLTHNLVNRYTVICESARRFITAVSRIPDEKVVTIYNCIDPFDYRRPPVINAIKEHYSIPLDKYVIGTIGSLTDIKNHDLFIRIACRVKEVIPNVYFIIVGKGPNKNKLLFKTVQKGINNSFKFIDNVTPVHNILYSFDVFLLTSKWEGFPVSVLEAMACEKPIISTDVGGVSEVIDFAINGYYVPVEEEDTLVEYVLQVLRDESMRKRMGNLNRKKIESSFQVDKMVRNYIDLYEECNAS